MPTSFADKVIEFNTNLNFDTLLPDDFQVLNPFVENPETKKVMALFYRKFYLDHQKRKFIIGINPSRHGAGVTGVPFTDTKRLDTICGIKMESAYTHEVSSVFLYDMIQHYGGAREFYSQFYINSPFPLAIIRKKGPNKWVNANYYDDTGLFEIVKGFMVESLRNHISLGLDTEEVYILGKKNGVFINRLNEEFRLFKRCVSLEHPRFIQQYKFKERQFYIDKYLLTLNPLL